MARGKVRRLLLEQGASKNRLQVEYATGTANPRSNKAEMQPHGNEGIQATEEGEDVNNGATTSENAITTDEPN